MSKTTQTPPLRCHCGAGCTGYESLTDPRVRSERDAVAKYIRFHGPMPVYREQTEAQHDAGEPVETVATIATLAEWDAFAPGADEAVKPSRSGGKGTGPGMSPDDLAKVAAANEYLAACRARALADDRTLDGFVQTILVEQARGIRADSRPFRMTPRMADVLLGIRDKEAARVTTMPRIADALAWCESNADANTFAASLLAGARRYGSLTQNQYDAVIRNIDATAERGDRSGPPADAVSGSPASAEGWYRVGDDVYKVQKAVHGSGNIYAKVLDVATGKWTYAPGVVRTLRESDRLSVEDAAAMGRLYGICMVCGAKLTDEASIERGIGPVCVTRL